MLTTSRITAVGVVVPVHDEQELLPACLASIERAAAGLTVHVVPVLDSCNDSSAVIAGPGAVVVDARNVGVARAAGFAEVLRRADRPADEVWVATTDADSAVPHDWLVVQLELAAAGADAVAGTVEVRDWHEQSDAVRAAFDGTYGRPGDGHAHLHGANLGVRGSAYLAVGGFPPLAVSEDVALVAALKAAGHTVAATGRVPVVTSARRQGRASGGFADHLVGLTTARP